MELELQRTVLEGYRPVLDTVLTQEETMESIVPDAFPDVSRITCAGGNAFLTAKQAGEGSAKITGTARVTVLYVPEGERIPRSLALSLPFQCVGDCPQIREDSQIHAAVLSACADARLLNPRKLFIKAEVKLRVTVYGRESREITCDLVCAEDRTIQKRTTECRDFCIAAVIEKPFLFSDSLRQSAAKPAMEELLSCRVEPGSLDAKYIGKKLICKGDVQLSVLYRSGEELVPARFELPFSQILDLEAGSEDGEPNVLAVLKSADCRLQEGELAVAVEMLIQATLWSRRGVTLLNDAYSTAAPLDVERSASPLCVMAEQGSRKEAARQFCEAGIPAKQVLSCSVSVGPLSSQKQEGAVRYSADTLVEILYLSEDDALCGVSYTVPVSCDTELPAGCACSCWCRPVGEAMAVPVTGGFEVRFEAEFCWQLTKTESVPCVSAIRPGTAAPSGEPRPSVIIRMVGKGESLWDIAKACGSTIGDICAANQLSSEEASDGAILLIPAHR